jgi:hypothetical protein
MPERTGKAEDGFTVRLERAARQGGLPAHPKKPEDEDPMAWWDSSDVQSERPWLAGTGKKSALPCVDGGSRLRTASNQLL